MVIIMKIYFFKSFFLIKKKKFKMFMIFKFIKNFGNYLILINRFFINKSNKKFQILVIFYPKFNLSSGLTEI